MRLKYATEALIVGDVVAARTSINGGKPAATQPDPRDIDTLDLL